ncbi:TPA: TDP-N-acetylfucosamine:lipid II N-acetylfucosaminyltransferase [Aeromonas veronii]
MTNIAHLAFDEKFIDNAVDFFEEAFPRKNSFYIFSRQPWRYLKKKNKYIACDSLDAFKFIYSQELSKYDIVVVHGLSSIFLPLLAIRKKNYIWIGWGYDYYQRSFTNILNEKYLYLSETKSLLLRMDKRPHDSLKIDKKTIKDFFVKKMLFLLDSKLTYRLSIRNVRVFCPVLPEEFELVKNTIGLGKNTVYKPWNYASLDKHLLCRALEKKSLGRDILLGNSATATNNHIDVLLMLSKFPLENRKIYVPLSYGDSDYAFEVRRFINENDVLSKSCVVMSDFIPLDEYNKIVSSCGFVIMNQLRQQALGNIVSLMYAGAKIFLREDSILFSHFKKQGAMISSIQELETDIQAFNTPLSEDDIHKNQSILMSNWSHNVILMRTKELVDFAIK